MDGGFLMCWLARISWVFVLLLVPVPGCTEVIEPTAPLRLRVSAFSAPDDPGVLLEGVRLCQTDTANCALSDATGWVEIELPIDKETSFTLAKEGYASFLFGEFLGENGAQHQFRMNTDRFHADLHDRVMSPYPMRFTGTVVLEINPPFAEATFDLADATGNAFYYDEEGWWSNDLTATTVWGWGGFTEVSRGEHQVDLGGTARHCVSSLGWPGDVANSVRFPVREGYTSWVSLICPLPP
jgi:hypothetical protein